eukprot:CAMPEP_0114565488 /NCGR_PEP_ID=MMETSP0114-20121206/14335_1 /TAXON_ID=31324 /ORGANISM="Goniomonas sp, Strain m" /LENGTH=67 /DNA_ID=CAMNT_0001751735 /DNA_START=21 /DNA_END=222 /DNA_ORIENTATION=+
MSPELVGQPTAVPDKADTPTLTIIDHRKLKSPTNANRRATGGNERACGVVCRSPLSMNANRRASGGE